MNKKSQTQQHDISYYNDGNVKVPFCRVCGVEDRQGLNCDCPGQYIAKKVDIDTEPY